MQKPLDSLRFKENRYERPNQEWVCGRAAEGRSCPLGPDERGKCRNTGECLPAKKGDRWFCMRSDAQGGACAEGPLPDGKCSHAIPPCQPVRSYRHSRGMLVWSAIAVTTGALLILLGGNFFQRWIDPGELTSVHATSAAKCSDCHSLDGAAHPTLAAFASSRQRGLKDSALCLKCHTLGDNPLNPHGVASSTLASIQKKLPNDSGGKPLFLRVSHAINPAKAPSGELTCVTCHQEHHGRDFDLKRLSNTQCQTCHSVQFASLQKGHPDFVRYPYRGRTRIFFDHASHLGDHFTAMKEKAPGTCQDCHVPGPGGRFMQVKNFNVTCAACHGAQIQGEGMGVKGVAFFTVPGIDTETLAAKGISIGEWPKFADAKMTPFMQLLLSRQPATRDAMQKLGSVDLLDLRQATPEQLAAAEQIAWGVKTLLFNLVVEGQSYLLEQLKGDISSAGLEVPAALLAAQADWMPHLLTDVANYQKGIKPPVPAATKPRPANAVPREKPAARDDSILGGDTGNDDLTAAAAAPTPSPSASKGDDDLSELVGEQPTVAASATPAAAASVAPKTAEEWVAAGGWYRPSDSLTLYYRPSGHADPFLLAWLTGTAQLEGKSAAPGAPDVFRQLADPQTPGVCMKCHTVDESGGATVVNWRPAQFQPENQPFTTFSHTTHFSLFGNTGCETCHSLNSKSEYAKYFSGETEALARRDPTRFQSNFNPLSKTLCIQCHRPQKVGDQCLLCHRYHIGTVVATLGEKGRSPRSLGQKN
jgi:hypothetical protein